MMKGQQLRSSLGPNPPSPFTSSDQWLVSECLRGNEQAWTTLIDKYRNFIYSIPIKYDASPEDAADIFQAVCLKLFAELPRLREVSALRSWLATVASHKWFQLKQSRQKRTEREFAGLEEGDEIPAATAPAPAMLEEFERAQMVREALAQLPPRCQEMIRLLFYAEPALPYDELARRLGLATGSIGFIRGRCLHRLQKTLEEMGFK